MKTIQIPVERRQDLFDKCMTGVDLTDDEIKEVIISLVQETREVMEQCNFDIQEVIDILNKKPLKNNPFRLAGALQENIKNLQNVWLYINNWMAFAIGTSNDNPIMDKSTADKLQEEVYRKLGVL